jgi:OmpA-OmpF porin, OOP family
MRQITRSILLGAALAWTASPAQAQWYVGASAGESRASFREGSQSDQLLALGFLSASTAIDGKGTMYRLHGGYRLHRHFAVELAYADLGKFMIRSTVEPAGSLETSVRSEGAELSALGLLPVGERLTLFARAGAFAARTKASYSGGGSVRLVDGGQSQTRRSTQAVYGVGATYDFTPSLALRVEWSRYGKLGDEFTGGELDADVLSAGIQWRF